MLVLDVTGRYELERELGRGGMGTVYRARDRETGGLVAIKVLHRKHVRDLIRFSREVGVLAELDHPGIARYLGHGELANGRPALVMEWVEGETLAKRVQAAGVRTVDAVAMMRTITDALATAHARGIVHRDIKPDNIMLIGEGFDRAKLIDFGVARRMGDVINLTRTGMRIGTPCYMSPEQARGEREIDARADVFMLGCVLYECTSGHRAFTGANAQALLSKIILVDPPPLDLMCPEAPPALAALVMRMLDKNPAVRPAGAGEVASALAALPAIPGGPLRTVAASEGEAKGSDSIETQLLRAPARGDHSTFVMLMVPPDDDELDDDDDTIEDEARDNLVRALKDEVRKKGLRVEVLANGSVLGILQSAEPPAQIATRLAECALSVKRWAPDVGVAFLSESEQDETLGVTLERGFANLETAAMRALSLAQGSTAVVHLDASTAQLLASQYTIVRDREDYQLVAEPA